MTSPQVKPAAVRKTANAKGATLTLSEALQAAREAKKLRGGKLAKLTGTKKKLLSAKYLGHFGTAESSTAHTHAGGKRAGFKKVGVKKSAAAHKR